MLRRHVFLVFLIVAIAHAFTPVIGVSDFLSRHVAVYIAAAFALVGLFFMVTRKKNGRRREYESIERCLVDA